MTAVKTPLFINFKYAHLKNNGVNTHEQRLHRKIIIITFTSVHFLRFRKVTMFIINNLICIVHVRYRTIEAFLKFLGFNMNYSSLLSRASRQILSRHTHFKILARYSPNVCWCQPPLKGKASTPEHRKNKPKRSQQI